MDLKGLSQSLLEDACIENESAGGARAYLHKCRALLLERHRAGTGGKEIVGAYTEMMDGLIRRLFEIASQDYIRRYPSLNPRCTLIAQGGYGRRELNPYSDIDLLFLHTWKVTPYVEAVAEKILYTLWDIGLQVGHATRSIRVCLRLAAKDIKVKTALLETRYLAGDSALYGEFEKSVEEQLIRKSAERYVREKLEERQRRHESFGSSVYLLEPDVKEGEGGLRDIHTAIWIAKVRQKVNSLDSLLSRKVISAKDLTALKGAQDFLLRIRNELHFSSGKHEDQLTFEKQEGVSLALGFEGENNLKRVEVFMRSYYLAAAKINRLTSLIIHRMIEPVSSNGDGATAGKQIRHGIRIARGNLYISDPAVLHSEPGNLISIFRDIQRHRVKISQGTRELIREHLSLIDEKFRRSAVANLPFFEILKWKEGVYDTLAEMHRCGVLGAFIPEFGRLLCMVLHDLYHIYTVDQHSLRLIMELERLRSGRFREALPLLTQLARGVEKIEILYLGLLFHDLGKGFGGGHSEIGSAMIKEIARRMRLNVDDAARVEFLVRHHLLLAQTAFRRDLEDEKTILNFAQTMGNITNMNRLYLLTYADIRSVGPAVWNNWKGSLLEELYQKALTVLEDLEKGEFKRTDRQAAVRRIRTRLRHQLSPQYGPEKVWHFVESMPERYFLSTPEDQIPAHFQLMEKFKGQEFISHVRHFPERDCSEFVLCAKDRPGLFASIAGVLAALGLDILNARITTSKDGLILDVFRISYSGRPEVVTDPRKWERVQSTLEETLGGRRDVVRLVAESEGHPILKKRVPKVSTVIEIDNEASDDFTIVEVYTQDRTGVLFTITYALHQLGLSIALAKISTNVDQVADVFYVADDRGGKIQDHERLEVIRRALYSKLVPEDDRIAQPLY